ncbi:MAG: LysR family transcriptional regulator [Clostridia bacterium]|nr:LysR family transcriptional regulator [Clostridia bacterium]
MFSSKDYVYEVYREKSFTLAAKKLFVSQPALSASIKKTETELGAELFDRRSTPIRLTEAGKAYIEAVEQIYAIEENLKNRLSDINSLKTGSVIAGSASFISSYLIPEILTAYKANFPGITVDLIEDSSNELKEKAINGLIDAVIDYDFDDAFFKSYPLKVEKIYIAALKSSAVAERLAEYTVTGAEVKSGRDKKTPPVPISLLADERFILLKRGNNMHTHASNVFKDAGVSPKNSIWLDQQMTAYNVCLKGLGLAFVTDTLIKTTEVKNAVFFRIDSAHAKRTLWIAHRKNMEVTGSLSRFISISQDVCKNI